MTSSIIIFFSHSVKLNDSIMILEGKDYIIEGKVTNIGLFFVTLETNNKEEITLPNNIFIQKSIRKKNPSNLSSTEEQSNSLVE
jgi:small-conductance mechanosensitive channel